MPRISFARAVACALAVCVPFAVSGCQPRKWYGSIGQVQSYSFADGSDNHPVTVNATVSYQKPTANQVWQATLNYSEGHTWAPIENAPCQLVRQEVVANGVTVAATVTVTQSGANFLIDTTHDAFYGTRTSYFSGTQCSFNESQQWGIAPAIDSAWSTTSEDPNHLTGGGTWGDPATTYSWNLVR